MISDRTLIKWRKESLEKTKTSAIDHLELTMELHRRILRLTQELIDINLLRKVSK